MADEKKPAVGDSGGEGGTNSDLNQDKGNQESTVSKDAYERVTKDMHKYKGTVKELESKLSQLEEERLKSTNDYKTLAEREKLRADKAEADKKNLQDVIVRTQKFDAVKKAALEAGLRTEALDDLDLLDHDGVVIEATSSGRFLVSGEKEYVQDLVTKKPHWFKKSAPPDVNGGKGGVPPGAPKKLTPNDVNQAEDDYRRGKISKDQYHAVYKAYSTQPKTT